MREESHFYRVGLVACGFLAAATIQISTGVARADVIPDGYRSVSSEVVVEGMENYPDLVFAIYPLSIGGDGGGMRVEKGTDLRFYHMVSPKLYALDPGADIKSAATFDDADVPRSEVGISQVGNVRRDDPAKFIRRVYKITGIEGNRISLERQPDQRYDAKKRLISGAVTKDSGEEPQSVEKKEKQGRDLMLAGGAGLVAFLAAIVLWIRRGQKAEAAAAE